MCRVCYLFFCYKENKKFASFEYYIRYPITKNVSSFQFLKMLLVRIRRTLFLIEDFDSYEGVSKSPRTMLRTRKSLVVHEFPARVCSVVSCE